VTIEIINKLASIIRQICPKKGRKEITLAKLSEKCNCTPEFLGYLRDGKQGRGIKLDYAIKIWLGLGHPPETLIADCNIDPLWAAKIKRVQASEYARIIELFLEVFSNWEFASPTELAKVEGYLEMIRDRIIEIKNRPLAESGGLLSNSSGDKSSD